MPERILSTLRTLFVPVFFISDAVLNKKVGFLFSTAFKVNKKAYFGGKQEETLRWKEREVRCIPVGRF
jgi:hypothetical protein